MLNFIKNFEISEVLAPISAASSTDSNSDIMDMAGWEGIVFIVPITDSVATGVATITAQQNTVNSDIGMAALSGASATATCVVNDDLNNQLLVLEVHKPRERYVQIAVTSATANIAFGNGIAIRYRNRKLPITDASTVLDATIVRSPAEA